MRRSFYEYLMTERKPASTDPVQQLANLIHEDIAFPKQSTDFMEISEYLEEQGTYPISMADFDLAWQRYLENEQ